jgi:hypothetical protein
MHKDVIFSAIWHGFSTDPWRRAGRLPDDCDHELALGERACCRGVGRSHSFPLRDPALDQRIQQ